MPKRILVIDDERMITQTTKNLLDRKGYTTVTTLNGKEALDLITHNDFDLILCDIRMPEMNGVETAKKIKELFRKQNKKCAPIIFFTGYAEGNAYDEAQVIGEILLKPYDMHELLDLVEKCTK